MEGKAGVFSRKEKIRKKKRRIDVNVKTHSDQTRSAFVFQFFEKRFMRQNSCAATIKLCAAWER